MNDNHWRAVLVDGFTQSSKTWKCFDVLSDKIDAMDGNVLVLFVTQANSASSVQQLLQRAQNHVGLRRAIPVANMVRSSQALPANLVIE
jgi:hypothetical protein